MDGVAPAALEAPGGRPFLLWRFDVSSIPKKPRERKSSQLELQIESDPSFLIYILCDPRESDPILRVRYVGVTRKTLKYRFQRHIQESRRGHSKTHKCNWIRSLLNAGVVPTIEDVEVGFPERSHDSSEIAWVKYFRDLGCPLTNGTDGGNTSPRKGHSVSQETRDKISRKLTGGHPSEEALANLRASFKRPDVIENTSRSRKGRKQSQETVQKRIGKLRGRVLSEEQRAVYRTACAQPEEKKRRSEAARAAWARPETKERTRKAQKEGCARPEVRARKSEAMRESWMKRKAAAAGLSGIAGPDRRDR